MLHPRIPRTRGIGTGDDAVTVNAKDRVHQSMIRKSVERFSEEIMLKQKAKVRSIILITAL
ncbi:hypothetical protein [Bradyrhizobium tropiciagri]|uniref:hypothetical protein n=1 Tax=Bradyrhizobium tropiciagri TaxID=312253 RepID=UPI00138F7EB3|nr:hypothetical protein [Bradyrhizobium tropiciagri]